MDEPGLTHISMGADDHRRILDRVEALGGQVVTQTDIGVAVFIRDPDGQLIELLETKRPSG
jgi:predicted enzyme related to lactoylglutathione lyase